MENQLRKMAELALKYAFSNGMAMPWCNRMKADSFLDPEILAATTYGEYYRVMYGHNATNRKVIAIMLTYDPDSVFSKSWVQWASEGKNP